MDYGPPPMEKKITLSGFLITLAGAILFSTKAIFVKLAFRSTHVDAVTLLALRMLFSLPFYLVAAWICQNVFFALSPQQHP